MKTVTHCRVSSGPPVYSTLSATRPVAPLLSKLRTAPAATKSLAKHGVRYIIWLDGATDRVAGGGSLSCAAGPVGGGCFSFAWWQNNADFPGGESGGIGQSEISAVDRNTEGFGDCGRYSGTYFHEQQV